MPRASLDSNHPAGPSVLLQIKMSKAAKAAAKAALEPGEELSAMPREAIRKEIQRRKRAKQ